MNEQEQKAFNKIFIKVKQHEQTIAQLVQIIAVTNQRITDLSLELSDDTNKKQSLAK